MEARLSGSAALPGPSGLNVHASLCVSLKLTGNGDSTNGSSDTPTRPGRKRVRRPEQWKRKAAQLKRTRGEEYVSPTTGKTVPSARTGPPCKCRKKCFGMFTDLERDSVLQSFYSLATKNLQDAHLFGLITSQPVQRRRPRKEEGSVKSPRLAAYTYEVRLPGKRVTVCQQAFASLHSISLSRVRRIAKATTTSAIAPQDMRGKHTSRPNKITPAMKKKVNEHIKSFPVMKSHYSRNKNKRRRYLSPLLSIAEMHRLYIQEHEGQVANPRVKYSYYAKVFNEEFNLSFGYPKSDVCGVCEQFKIQLNSEGSENSTVREKHEEHLRSAEKFYSELRLDTNMAKKNAHVTITFDFQQNLPLPHLPVGDLFYMHQLWLYVFGVHSCGDNKVTMFCWPETAAKRGSDEVVSCLHATFTKLPPEVTSLRLYSDGCGGQNKNSNVMRYLFSLVYTGRFRYIRHTFPVHGHSFLPNDRDFGRTEVKKRQNERIYTPSQWVEVIKQARQRKPFDVVEADQSMFLDFDVHFTPLFKKVIKKSGKSLNIQKAQVLEYSADHASEVWVKYTLLDEEEWSKFSLLKARKVPSLPSSSNAKYDGIVPVKTKKAADIKKIVKKYVPQEFQSYYDGLVEGDVSSETDESDD